MAVYTIPIRNAATLGAFFFVVSLDGKNYQLDFQYNDREGFWYMKITGTSGEIIREGIKVVVNWDLIQRIADVNRPPGVLMALDSRQVPADPTLETWGKEQVLSYIEQASVPVV